MSFVLVFSGGIGSDRSKLAASVASALGWSKAKFSDEIKKRIEAAGEDPNQRSKLQSFGQDMVQNDLAGFVQAVLDSAGFEPGSSCVVDGLRHIEVLLELKERVEGSTVGYIHVHEDVTRIEKSAEERGINEQNLFRYNQALSEAQIPRILPAYADIELDAADGLRLNTEKVLRRFDLKRAPSAD